QALSEEGCYFANHEDVVTYEAVLYAASELPEEVGVFCLEMAQRRDLAPDIQTRVTQTLAQRQEEQRRLREANPLPSRAVALPPMLGFHDGLLRDPWPDGPRERVCNAFQQACLESGAFPDLIRVRPHIALEVLLAVCIEEPQRDNPYDYSVREDYGVNHWQAGYPPLYFRGPFLVFLREAPQEGLSFVLRLVNFATRRWTAIAYRPRPYLDIDQEAINHANSMPGIDLLIGDRTQRWIGDGRAFRWHHDLPLQCNVIPCALMALEQWLYEELDHGKDLQAPLNRLLEESESL